MPRLLQYSDIENVYDDPERAGRLAGLLAARGGDDALVVGAGDDTAPGVLSAVARGRQAIDFFRAADTDFETFGNHDFDYGPDRTRELVADSPQRWLSANVRDRSGRRFGAEEGVRAHATADVGGARVGLFGVTDPATDSLNPMAADLDFADPYEAAADAAAALRAAGADYVVALSHLGRGDAELARRVDLDAVLGGHVHTERIERVDGTLLTRPGVNGRTVIEVELAEGPSAVRRDPADADPVESLSTALASRVAAAGLDEAVGRVETPVARDEATVSAGECRVGNFVADAYRWTTGADVGLQNSGGIRAGDPLTGQLTIADLISVVPFEEPVVTVELTGEELLTALGQATASSANFGDSGWWHAHVSGARLVWDDAADELVGATVGGEPVDPERLYTVATAEYLLHSDHEFPAIEERHRAGEGEIQHEALAAYARATGVDPEIEGRIERVDRGADDADAADASPGAAASGESGAGAGEGESDAPADADADDD